MTPAERERLIEEVAGAHRDRDPRGGVRPSPSYYDLEATDRVLAYEQATAQRQVEAAIDPEGESCTVKAVLAILRRV
jgi:hypothetical protein